MKMQVAVSWIFNGKEWLRGNMHHHNGFVLASQSLSLGMFWYLQAWQYENLYLGETAGILQVLGETAGRHEKSSEHIGAMPAAYRKKKKSPLRKSSKLKSRQLRISKTRKEASLKPVTKNGKTSGKSTHLSLDDSMAMKQLQRNSPLMTSKAKMVMAAFIKNLYKWVSVEAERLRKERNRCSIGFSEVRTALKSIMPAECNKCKEGGSRSGGARYTKAS